MEQEEIWVACHDYEKERDDLLSFRNGDRFKVMSKSSEQWWAVKNLATCEVGYVPASYLKLVIDKSPQVCNSNDDDDEPETVDIRKKLMQVAQRQEPPSGKAVLPPNEDDIVEVLPKKVPHPSKSSASHKHLHKEIQLSNKLGGTKQLGKPELQKVMDRRRPDSEGRPGTITGRPRTEENLGDKELASRLKQQSKKLELASESLNDEVKKPEFMKITLNKLK